MTTSARVDPRLEAAARRLAALSCGCRLEAIIRVACADAMSLPPLPFEAVVDELTPGVETVVARFAEQFSVDVTGVTDDQRHDLIAVLGGDTFRAVVLMYVADFLPRVTNCLDALGLSLRWAATAWDRTSEPSSVVFDEFLPAVARLRALDPVTSELVRLRGAAAHNCRLCKSVRESSALDAGGSEALYAEVERFETSSVITDAQKAALRLVDAMVWAPASVSDAASGVRRYFSDAEAVELVFDVMRNASNKVAVALAADTPRVRSGTERYLIDADGQTVFG